ncbi:hypothetical protein DRO55_01560 [Candidatus Bathyarchaeota archaeon]|nr:MAG: hypothetical protein DRO55_01560 [Candidatus Bathyarchaeota archaeon]
MGLESELEDLRRRVEGVTLEILRLCAERLKLVRRIGEVKRELGIPVEVREVEERLKHTILEGCKAYNLNEAFGLKLLELLLEESKGMQRRILEEK